MSEQELTPTENQGEKVSEWVNAPEDSHVARFRLIDRSGSEFGASSEIWVTFKSSIKNHKAPASYRYTFATHDEARSVWAALKGSAHPGEVVHSELILPRVPYQRVS
jgi:hypothetical protein